MSKPAQHPEQDFDLEEEQAVELPNREAMSLIGGGGILGGPPTVSPLLPEPAATGPATTPPEPTVGADPPVA